MKLGDVAQPGAKFFLKSEYGPISDSWPAMSFSRTQLKTWLIRNYRPGLDFVVYAATGGPDTPQVEHRSRLLSLVRIDLTQTYRTEQLIPPERWKWAMEHYPGQWEWSFGPIEAWSIDAFPRASDVCPDTYARVGQHPNQGMVLEITDRERAALLEYAVSPVALPKRGAMRKALTLEAIRKDVQLGQESQRIAELVVNRVDASGTLQQRLSPMRTAPTDLVLRVAEMLREAPLVCGLCGGIMQIRPANRLLQPSPDRIDSAIGSYGPENFHLAHLACNLAKNNATAAQFEEWLTVIRGF